MLWSLRVCLLIAFLFPVVANAQEDDVERYQYGLIFSGHYTGPVDGLIGPRTRQAIINFQTEVGETPTGQLTLSQSRELERRLDNALAEFGVYPVLDEHSGIWLMLPGSLLRPEGTTRRGFRYAGSVANIELETISIPASEQSFRELYERLTTSTATRLVEYNTTNEEWFVVQAREGSRILYARFFTNGLEHRGFSVAYDRALRRRITPLVNFISESFAPFTPPPDNLPEGGLSFVEPAIGPPVDLPFVGLGSGFYLGSEGIIVTDASVVESCQLVTLVNGEPITVRFVDRSIHLGLLQATPPRDFLRFSDQPIQPGDAVTTLGIPLSETTSNRIDFWRGTIASPNGPDGQRTQFLVSGRQTDIITGGPILDQNGRVIGLSVNTMTTQRYESSTAATEEPATLGIHIEPLMIALRASGFMTDNEDDFFRSKPDKEDPSGVLNIVERAEPAIVQILCHQ